MKLMQIPQKYNAPYLWPEHKESNRHFRSDVPNEKRTSTCVHAHTNVPIIEESEALGVETVLVLEVHAEDPRKEGKWKEDCGHQRQGCVHLWGARTEGTDTFR